MHHRVMRQYSQMNSDIFVDKTNAELNDADPTTIWRHLL